MPQTRLSITNIFPGLCMTTLSSSPAWVCSKCRCFLVRAHVSLRFQLIARAHQLAFAKTFRTSAPSTSPSYRERVTTFSKDARSGQRRDEEKDKRKKFQRPRAKGWQALLKNKSLGKASSIIVLRDSETNSASDEQAQEHHMRNEEDLKGVTAQDILSSLKARQHEPTLEEVRGAIEVLWRQLHINSVGTTNYISNDEFNKVAELLRNGFSRTQLAKYIAAREREAASELREAQSMPAASSKHQSVTFDPRPTSSFRTTSGRPIILKSVWQSDKKPFKERRRLVGKGKIDITDHILKHIWNVYPFQEGKRNAVLSLQLDMQGLMLLLAGGDDSISTALTKEHGVTINFVPSKGLVKITGGRMACEAVADAIAAIGTEMMTAQFDTRQFPHGILQTQLNEDVRAKIEEHTRCSIVPLGNDGIFNITALSADSADHCQRVLHSTLRKYGNNLETHFWNDDTEALATLIQKELCEVDTTASSGNLAEWTRFHIPQKLSKSPSKHMPSSIDLGADGKILESLTRDIGHQTFDSGYVRLPEPSNSQLNPNDKINKVSKTRYPRNFQADIGQILHSISANSSGIPGEHNHWSKEAHRKTTFTHSVSGLVDFLTKRSKHVERLDFLLRVRLEPVTSSCNQYGGNTAETAPNLNLELSFDKHTKQFSMRCLSTEMPKRPVGLMMPDLSHDVIIRTLETLQVAGENHGTQLADFIKCIRHPLLGNDKISAPLWIRLRLPRSQLSSAESSQPESPQIGSRTGEVEVEYFVSELQQENEVVFDQSGLDLVYSFIRSRQPRVDRESLSLRTPRNWCIPNEEEYHSENRSSITAGMHDAKHFVSQIRSLVMELERGIDGHMHTYSRQSSQGGL